MQQPVYRGGWWWHQRPDGSWLRWNDFAHRWIEQPGPPPVSTPNEMSSQTAQVGAAPSRVSGQQIVDPSAPRLAQWWRRLVALLLDFVVLLVPLVTLYLIVDRASAEARCDSVTGACSTNPSSTALAFFLVSYFVILPAYFVLMNGSRRGQTIGKRAMSVRVCDKDTGESIGYGRALGRWLMEGLFWFFGFVGVLNSLWPLWDPMRQAWHDKVVNSVVVSAPR